MDMDDDSDGLLAQQEKETNSIAVSITGEDPGVYFIKSNNYCCSVFLICQYACIETCMYLHKDG